MHLVVSQRYGREINLARNIVGRGAGERRQTGFDLDHRLRVNVVRGLGADDVNQVDVQLCQRGLHHIRGLFLAIHFAAVRDGRTVGKIAGPGWAIVQLPQSLLVVGRGLTHIFLLKEAEELGRLGKTSARVRGEPVIGIVCGELPASGPTH